MSAMQTYMITSDEVSRLSRPMSIHIDQEKMDAYIRQMKAIVDSLSRKVDAALQEERKVAEVSWWDLHKWKVLVPVVLVIIATTFIYKYRKK